LPLVVLPDGGSPVSLGLIRHCERRLACRVIPRYIDAVTS
jgi:hypothetical protein